VEDGVTAGASADVEVDEELSVGLTTTPLLQINFLPDFMQV
jgi:hypothetical protein